MTAEPDSDRLIGVVLGSRYRIEARLGHGAMGTVYRARHVQVGHTFAVKVLHRQLVGDDQVRRRFAREAALAGSLHHANVASVIDAGEMLDGRRYLVMDHARGETLLDLLLRDAPLSAARFTAIVRQLCSGLAHAHDLGLIHRDLKPENVIVERDVDGSERPRIIDFGVAIVRDDASSSGADRLTAVGLVVGTPQYMAPEHATGAAIDHRVDLFALGVMCFELLTGVPPYEGSGVDLARANLLQPTPAMRVRAPHVRVDPLLEAFTRRLMMKSRDDRPASAHAARALLDLVERDRPAAARALGVTLDEAGPGRAAPHLAATSPGSWAASSPAAPAAERRRMASGSTPPELAASRAAPAVARRRLEPAAPPAAVRRTAGPASPDRGAVSASSVVAPAGSIARSPARRVRYVVAAAAVAVLATMAMAMVQRRASRSAPVRPPAVQLAVPRVR